MVTKAMSEEEVNVSYTSGSGFWVRSDKKIQSDFLCRPYILSLLGDVKGKTIADIGCGEGYLCRKIYEKGALKVIGVDISGGLIQKAKDAEKSTLREILYEVGTSLDLKMIASESIDKTVSSLVYGHFRKEEFLKDMSEHYRILKEGGEFVLAVPHPFMYLARPKTEWIKFDYEKIEYKDDAEAKIRLYDFKKSEFKIKAYTHKIESYLQGLKDSGFMIEEIVEPMPTQEDLKTFPEMWGEETTIPTYLIIRAKKMESITSR